MPNCLLNIAVDKTYHQCNCTPFFSSSLVTSGLPFCTDSGIACVNQGHLLFKRNYLNEKCICCSKIILVQFFDIQPNGFYWGFNAHGPSHQSTGCGYPSLTTTSKNSFITLTNAGNCVKSCFVINNLFWFRILGRWKHMNLSNLP